MRRVTQAALRLVDHHLELQESFCIKEELSSVLFLLWRSLEELVVGSVMEERKEKDG